MRRKLRVSKYTVTINRLCLYKIILLRREKGEHSITMTGKQVRIFACLHQEAHRRFTVVHIVIEVDLYFDEEDHSSVGGVHNHMMVS